MPYDGRSGDELAEATGLSVRDISHAVDWLELHGYARVDRSLGGSTSYHFFVAVTMTERGRRAYEQKRL
jgi:DNA-binding MarR family transcriptional regulator